MDINQYTLFSFISETQLESLPDITQPDWSVLILCAPTGYNQDFISLTVQDQCLTSQVFTSVDDALESSEDALLIVESSAQIERLQRRFDDWLIWQDQNSRPSHRTIIRAEFLHRIPSMLDRTRCKYLFYTSQDLAISQTDLLKIATRLGNDLTVELASEIINSTGGWPMLLAQHWQELLVGANQAPAHTKSEINRAITNFFPPHAEALYHSLARIDEITPKHRGQITKRSQSLLHYLPQYITSVMVTFPLIAKNGSIIHNMSVPRWVQDAINEELFPPSSLESEWHALFADDFKKPQFRQDSEICAIHSAFSNDWANVAHIWGSLGPDLMNGSSFAIATALLRIPRSALEAHPSLLHATYWAILKAKNHYQENSLVFDKYSLVQTLAPIIGSDRWKELPHWERLEVLTLGSKHARWRGKLDVMLKILETLDAHFDLTTAQLAFTNHHRVAYYGERSLTLLHAGRYKEATKEKIPQHSSDISAVSQSPDSANYHFIQAVAHAFTSDIYSAKAFKKYAIATVTQTPWIRAVTTHLSQITDALVRLHSLDPGYSSSDTSPQLPVTHHDTAPLSLYVETQAAIITGDVEKMLAKLNTTYRRSASSVFTLPFGSSMRLRSLFDLSLARGDATRVHHYFDSSEQRADPLLYVPYARLCLKIGDLSTAISVANTGFMSEHVILRDKIELLLIITEAIIQNNGSLQAHKYWDQAVKLSVESSILLPFLAMNLQDFVQLNSSIPLPKALAKRVVPHLKKQETFKTLQVVKLTPREKAVLNELQYQTSLIQIAKVHTVSVNTVKKQLSSLYRKLGVNDRSAALIEASRLGLLPGDAPLAMLPSPS